MMEDLKKLIGKDVIVYLKDGSTKTGIFRGNVITGDYHDTDEIRLLNGIFVTRVKIDDISDIKEMPSD